MGDRIRIGDVSESAVAAGRGARARNQVEPASVRRLRRELDTLRIGLAAEGETARVAHGEVVALQRAVDAKETEAEEVETRWAKLRAALVALGVTGAVGFGADLGQIATSVQDLLTALGP